MPTRETFDPTTGNSVFEEISEIDYLLQPSSDDDLNGFTQCRQQCAILDRSTFFVQASPDNMKDVEGCFEWAVFFENEARKKRNPEMMQNHYFTEHYN